MKACNFNHGGQCCNCGATQYLARCKQPCDYIRPATRIERIKAMTVEEMAVLFNDLLYEGACNNGLDIERECDGNCIECIKQYLESEVQGE